MAKPFRDEPCGEAGVRVQGARGCGSSHKGHNARGPSGSRAKVTTCTTCTRNRGGAPPGRDRIHGRVAGRTGRGKLRKLRVRPPSLAPRERLRRAADGLRRAIGMGGG